MTFTNSHIIVSKHGSGRHNLAFLIEAMVILALLMACMAVFVRLFAGARMEGKNATLTSQAVLAATNCAEEFSANPAESAGTTTTKGLTVTCEVDPKPQTAGTLYDATITVSKDGTQLYELQTSRYVHDAGGDAS